MDNIVITIARQYGSGGNEIGEKLADELGIHFYNREIMRLASDDSGINEDLFLEADEKLKGSTLFKISKRESTPLAFHLPTISSRQETCLTIRQRSSRSWRKQNPV